MNLQTVKQRSAYWDNMKGFLILTVVFAHFLWEYQILHFLVNLTVDCIYMFHMPAFVFISGYFGKSDHSRSAESIIKLLLLYFVFNSAMRYLTGLTSLLYPWLSYWYLLAVIAWRISACYLAKIPGIQVILLTISILVGFFPSIDHAFSAAKILVFYPFYMAGYLLKPEKSDALIQLPYRKRLLKGLPFLIAAGLLALFAYQRFNYSDNALTMGAYQNPTEFFGRICLFLVASLSIYALRTLSPTGRIPFFTEVGRNSLWIFILHRPITVLANKVVEGISFWYLGPAFFFASFALCFLLGNDLLAKYLNRLADFGTRIIIRERAKTIHPVILATGLVLFISFGFVTVRKYTEVGANLGLSQDILYTAMSDEKQAAFDDAFRITFSGDLILLEDQVKRAYTGDGYDFSPVFEYAQDYIASADYAIGVFEGPMAGEDAGYSSSNFGDGKTLYLNFPDEFGEAVKNAGFDLVTTANNHLLDRGPEGALRTLDVLDEIGLDHTGSYRNASDKQDKRIKLVECEGIRMAILSFTFGSNGYSALELADGDLSYASSVISGRFGSLFNKLKSEVEQDFEEAKKYDPDLIIVLPHIGTEFINTANREQITWFKVFKECGADIILGDHPHAVQPAFIEEHDGRKIFTAYCPGNFANIYREDQGDTSMLIDVYIDRSTKQVIGGGIVPLYTQSSVEGNYRALPIYKIVNDTGLREQLSTDDYQRAQNSNNIITKVVLGSEMEISGMTERYYFDETGFLRAKTTGLEFTNEMKNGTLYKALEKAGSICFIGDSLTEGTKNGGCPWYEPILEHMENKTVYNFSKGSTTVSYMNKNIGAIPEAELYVVAIGTNDVRYRSRSVCAMTSEDYVVEINKLRADLQKKNAMAEFVFIAPWYSTDGDTVSKLPFEEKTALNNEYTEALKNYCQENELGFVDPNPYIQDILKVNPDRVFLLDFIHPNAGRGVVMYSEAALLS